MGARTSARGSDGRHQRAQDLVLARASAPNVVPHVSKATGVYLNSMLAVTEANRAGLRRGDPAHRTTAIVAGRLRREHLHRARTASIYTPDSRRRILPGITRDTVIQIASVTSATRSSRNRSSVTDLYLADECSCAGTAAEVTPLRVGRRPRRSARPGPRLTLASVKAHRHRPRRQRALVALARVRVDRTGAKPRHDRSKVREIPLSRPWLDERCEEEARPSVVPQVRPCTPGPWIDRFEEQIAAAS